MNKIVKIIFVSVGILSLNSCTDKDGSINIFPVSKDVELGAQVAAEIEKDPTTYPLLALTGNNGKNEQAHAYLNAIVDKIKASGKLLYKDEFVWKVRIIKDDNTLNAFCTPGGYIYVYTGLIKYLDKADHLAGVMGHEMAHADHRHSTDAMTRDYGVQTLLDVVLGKSSQSTIVQMAKNMAGLKYSRTNESEADASSVNYLAGTGYACNGAAGFFEKLIADGNNPQVPEFLSTHPNPDNRVAAINTKATSNGCLITDSNFDPTYANFKSYLP
jgi:predicted Zn-dependent protease